MVDVLLITNTMYNPVFLSATAKLLDRSLTRGLDAKNIRFGDMASFIAVASEFEVEGQDPRDAIKNAGNILRHASIAFLVVMSDVSQLISQTRLTITLGDEDVAIISGNLEEWKTAIVNCCLSKAPKLTREFGTKILKAFDALGLSGIFENYSRSGKDPILLRLL